MISLQKKMMFNLYPIVQQYDSLSHDCIIKKPLFFCFYFILSMNSRLYLHTLNHLDMFKGILKNKRSTEDYFESLTRK